MGNRIFWREKGTRPWREGWIVERHGEKIKIGTYIDSYYGTWYDKKDLDVEERKD